MILVLQTLGAESLADALGTSNLLLSVFGNSVLWRLNRVLGGGEYKLGKLHEGWSLSLLILEHESNDLNDMVGVSLAQFLQACFDQLLSIIDGILLVESSHILHGCELEENETTGVDI